MMAINDVKIIAVRADGAKLTLGHIVECEYVLRENIVNFSLSGFGSDTTISTGGLAATMLEILCTEKSKGSIESDLEKQMLLYRMRETEQRDAMNRAMKQGDHQRMTAAFNAAMVYSSVADILEKIHSKYCSCDCEEGR